MAREISIKTAYFANSDEATLKAVISALSKEFLLIPLGDYRIEVNEMDYQAVVRALDEFKRDIELNSRR
jgi:ribonuclease HI